MRPASSQPSSYLDRTSLQSRIAAFFLALAVSALIVIMLLRLGALPPRITDLDSKPIVVELLKAAGMQHAHPRAVARPKRASTPIKPPPIPPPLASKLNMLVLSHEDFAAADISRLPSHPADAAAGDSSGQADSASASGPGEGPHGERLYNAEWYREPSHAELATYLPAGRGEDADWGMIACRTIERYHVDDCEELGESPSGSGLARALREAAWQFLVRPPRVGGRTMVGAWVRIKFTFTHEVTKQ